jgi:tetratricopeptide (TPR) repeat protein
VMMLFTAGAAGPAETAVIIKSPEVRNAWGLLNPPSPENIGKARTLLDAALKRNPKDVEARMALVDLRIMEYRISPQAGAGGLQDALKHVDAVLKMKPNLEDAHRKKSLLLFLTGKKEEGLKLLKTALKKWPASQQMHEACLAYLLNLGKVKDAEAFSNLKNSRVKNKKEMLIRLGHVWQQAGYPEQAEECYEHSLNLGETPQGWAAVGRSNMLKKDYPLAIEFFQKALAIDSRHYAVYNDLAFCYHQTGQPREAIRWMEPYVQAFPDDLAALGNLAGLYEGVGEKVKARLAWMKIEATTRDPQQARLAEERLEKLKAK